MFIISTLFLLLSGCEKPTATMTEIDGTWGLTQTELFENEVLSALAESKEITTYYAFESLETAQLTISEDGEKEVYPFQYQPDKQALIIAENKFYYVEKLTNTDLILSIAYDNFKSRYTFSKIQ